MKPVKKKKTKEEKKITKEELSVSIGKVIREFRLSKKMSIESLSNETGLGYSQLSRIERGKINTSIYHIYIIVKTMNIPIKTILKSFVRAIMRSYKAKS